MRSKKQTTIDAGHVLRLIVLSSANKGGVARESSDGSAAAVQHTVLRRLEARVVLLYGMVGH